MLKITGGKVYDPANNIDGEVRDLWVDGGRMVAPPTDPGVKPTRTIDARGLVVMPGGIDMHCHIAGPKVNAARKLRADDRSGEAQAVRRSPGLRSGTLGSVPSTFTAAYKYAALGYTTVFDAAVSPLGARQAHQELADTPCLDKGFYTLLGNNQYAMRCLAEGAKKSGNGGEDKLRAYLGWLLDRTKSFAPKLVNPGGVEVWKQGGGAIEGIDDNVGGFNVTPRQIITGIARAANELGLPHPVHLHCNQLGMPGNWRTTLDSMRAFDGLRGHLTHIQFHSYGGGGAPGGDNGNEETFRSQVAPLAEYINAHPELTVDVGQVMFGQTTTMTGDSALGHYLHRSVGGRWISHDTELEGGCGVVPIEYKNKNLVHALQWAVGLEWYLLVDDPWRVVMSTDHPNGGSFLAYPELIRLLMDRTYRADVLATCPPALLKRCQLADLDREYSLSEIAIITRAGPARILGLPNKGHLGPGADADITILTPSDNPAEMFSLPRHVLKGGELMIENGELRTSMIGKTFYVQSGFDDERARTDNTGGFREWFDNNASVRFANYGVDDSDVAPSEAVTAATS